jgi:hypothetical protein
MSAKISLVTGQITINDADILPADAALHSVDWWLMGEDLPDPHNRVSLKEDKISLEYTDNNIQSFDRSISGLIF